MRHISVSLRRSTKAETEVHELQNYRHARHNLKVIALKINTSAQKEVSLRANAHIVTPQNYKFFQTPANLLRHAESKIKTATEKETV